MLSNIPAPAIPGHVIGMVSTTDDRFVSVYWNNDINKVVYNSGRKWMISEDQPTVETLAALFNVSKTDLTVSSFRLLEHGREITKNSDVENFGECSWSDYCQDNLCVSVELKLTN